MRELTLLLLLLNLGYAGWWYAQPAMTPDVAAVAPPLEMPGLVLLREVAPLAEVSLPEPQTAVQPPLVEPQLEVVPMQTQALPATPRCYRLGPWSQVQERTAMQSRWKAEMQHPWEDTIEVPKRYWVTAQPAPGQADALIARARAQQIKAWLLNQGAWRGRVAFGNFREQRNAEQKRAAVRATGIEAELVTETEQQVRYWLDIAEAVRQPPSDVPLVNCPAAGG